MQDFWLSCGHHLLDRDDGGGLLVTDEFLKAYLARPELTPPPDACIVERTLHAALLTNPRRPVAASALAARSSGSRLRSRASRSRRCASSSRAISLRVTSSGRVDPFPASKPARSSESA